MGITIVENFAFSPNTYLFDAGSGLRSLEIANQIYLSGQVNYAYPNWWKTMTTRAIPNDPLYPDQWHLNNTGQGGGTAGEDVNVTLVWDRYGGSDNEVIAIVDDGLELLHEDLAPNILSGYSWDYVGNDPDPTAGYHGTSVAGVAAGRGWNALGITGAAPYTKLIGYRINYTDPIEAKALSNNTQIVDIYSNSWGPSDDRHLESPGPLTLEALSNGTANGRGGKGNIYVWAGGNGNSANELLADNSNYDGYANSRYVMAVAASTNFGNQSWYSENGANLLVNAPSSGGSLGITTTDRTGALGYNATNYTSTFGGTSSATPLVSGIISLMLQANPNLTWRDVRLIVARTAKKNDPTDADWTRNGAGYNISHKYGFGRIDAYTAVNIAANWTNVGSEIFVSAYSSPNLSIPDNSSTGVSDTINITQNAGIEFVEINFTAADHTYWGDLEIELISPSGTSSILAKKHNVANGTQRYDNWTFGSVRHMGEPSQDTWRLNVKDLISGDTGTFQKWSLTIYGNQFLPGWSNRKQKNITGTTAGAQTNYQMKLTVYKGSGTDSPGVVYLGGNVRDDFGDIRFTKSDGVTLLDYWIESYTSGVSAVVWVEVDSIPASPNTASVYLYYGNPSAASASNGTAAFVLFDDFSYTDSPANHGWSTPSGGTWVIDSGALKAWGGNWIYIRKPPASVDIAIAYRAKIGSTADYYSTRFVWNNPGGYGHGYGVDPGKPGNLGKCAAEICMSADIVAGSGTSDTSWHTFEARRYNGSFESYYDGTSKGTGTSNTYNSNANLELIFANNNQNSDPNRAAWWDDIRVRKYASPEPAWGT